MKASKIKTQLQICGLSNSDFDKMITFAMSKAGGNVKKAAGILGISNRSLYRFIQERKKLGEVKFQLDAEKGN